MTDDASGRVLQDLRSEAEGEGGLDRKHGQQILDLMAARNSQRVDPLVEILNRAHQAKVEADKE